MSIRNWCTFLALIGKTVLLLASVAAADDYRLAPPTKKAPIKIAPPADLLPDVKVVELLPLSPEEAPPAPEATEAPAVAEVDPRPVVIVDTRPANQCAPCGAFHGWLATYKDLFPLRFDVREHATVNAIPREILEYGSPLFRFQGADGKWYPSRGFEGPERLLRDYQAHNPKFGRVELPAQVAAPVGASPLELFAKFAGPGKFSFQPDKPVGTYVDEATYLEYSRLAGTVKFVAGSPVIVLDQPLPNVSKKMWGLWFKVQVLRGTGNLADKPQTMTIEHTRGKLKIKLEDIAP